MTAHRDACLSLARWCLDECRGSPVTTHRVWLWMLRHRPDDMSAWDISLYDARRTLHALHWMHEAREVEPDLWEAE